jgi:hypothetical protein
MIHMIQCQIGDDTYLSLPATRSPESSVEFGDRNAGTPEN